MNSRNELYNVGVGVMWHLAAAVTASMSSFWKQARLTNLFAVGTGQLKLLHSAHLALGVDVHRP